MGDRKPYPSDVTDAQWALIGPHLIGLALAVNAVAAGAPQPRDWLRGVLQDDRLRPPTTPLHLFQEHTRHLLGLDNNLRLDPGTLEDAVDLAAPHWLTGSAARPGARRDPASPARTTGRIPGRRC